MGENTRIEWCHHTFNPWRGCTKVSGGCKNCYAETLSGRNPATLGQWGPKGTRVIAAESYWRQPIRWNEDARNGVCRACKGDGFILESGTRVTRRTVEDYEQRIPCDACAATGKVEPYRSRVFCASLADVFEADDTMPEQSRKPVQDARVRLFALIKETPNLDWLLLTKRPENIEYVLRTTYTPTLASLWHDLEHGLMPNVWIGTSVEDQPAADLRTNQLRQIPARVRFLSCEPLIGSVRLNLEGIHWVIVGGESGPNARPMHPDWVRSLCEQCSAAGVPFHFKQWGRHLPYSQWQSYSPNVAEQRLMRNRYDHNERSIRSIHAHNALFFPMSKGEAGRLLDGVLHDAYPQVVA